MAWCRCRRWARRSCTRLGPWPDYSREAFLGDIGDFIFKSNQKNLELLKRHAHGVEPPRTIDRIVVFGAILLVIVTAGSGVWLCWLILKWVLSHLI